MVVGNNIIFRALNLFNLDSNVEIKSTNNGINSSVFIIDEKFVLKFYRQDNNNPSRLERELFALKLFNKHKIDNVPKLINYSKEYNCILMSFISGTTINIFNSIYFEQFADFYKKVLMISNLKEEKYFDSIDSCPHFDLLLNQLNTRISNLSKENNKNVNNILEIIKKYIYITVKNINTNYYNNLKKELSVVDFGINNTILLNNNLFFIDFEFFGLDNPVHLISDTISHPANNLNLNDQIILLDKLSCCHINKDEIFAAFKGTNILFDLKWCLIMLNPFLSSYSLNTNEELREEKKIIQLNKVENKISIIKQKISNEIFFHK